jgi:TP901 family phage tail tape measure protein
LVDGGDVETESIKLIMRTQVEAPGLRNYIRQLREADELTKRLERRSLALDVKGLADAGKATEKVAKSSKAAAEAVKAEAAELDKLSQAAKKAQGNIEGVVRERTKLRDGKDPSVTTTSVTGTLGQKFIVTDGDVANATIVNDRLAGINQKMAEIKALSAKTPGLAEKLSVTKEQLDGYRKLEAALNSQLGAAAQNSEAGQRLKGLIRGAQADEARLTALLEDQLGVRKRLDDLRRDGFRQVGSPKVAVSGTSDVTTTRFERLRSGEVNGVTRQFRDLVTQVESLDRVSGEASVRFNRMSEDLSRSGSNARFAAGNFIENTLTVTKWALSVGALYGALGLLKAGLSDVLVTERRQAALSQVVSGEFDDQASAVERLRVSLLNLAAANGRSSQEAIDSATKFARLGLTRAQILEGVTVALKASNVAEIDAATATEQLVAILKTYELTITDLSGVLEGFNRLSNRYNVTVKDLLGGLSRVGELAKTVGLTKEAITALIGTGSGLTGRPGTEFGQSLKSIFVSLSNSDIQDKLRTLFDFDVNDQNGQLRDMDDILADLSVKFQTLSRGDQQQLLQVVGQKQQASKLATLLNGYTQAQANLLIQLEKGNTVEEENARIRETLVQQLEGLGTAYGAFATSVATAGGESASLLGVLKNVTGGLRNLLRFGEANSELFVAVAAAAGLYAVNLIRTAAAARVMGASQGFLARTVQGARDQFGALRHAQGQYVLGVATGSIATNRLTQSLARFAVTAQSGVAPTTVIGRAAALGDRALRGMASSAVLAARGIGGIASMVGGILILNAALSAVNAVINRNDNAIEQARRSALGYSAALDQARQDLQAVKVLQESLDSLGKLNGVISPAALKINLNLLEEGARRIDVLKASADDIGKIDTNDKEKTGAQLNDLVLSLKEKQLGAARAARDELGSTIRGQEIQLRLLSGIVEKTDKQKEAVREISAEVANNRQEYIEAQKAVAELTVEAQRFGLTMEQAKAVSEQMGRSFGSFMNLLNPATAGRRVLLENLFDEQKLVSQQRTLSAIMEPFQQRIAELNGTSSGALSRGIIDAQMEAAREQRELFKRENAQLLAGSDTNAVGSFVQDTIAPEAGNRQLTFLAVLDDRIKELGESYRGLGESATEFLSDADQGVLNQQERLRARVELLQQVKGSLTGARDIPLFNPLEGTRERLDARIAAEESELKVFREQNKELLDRVDLQKELLSRVTKEGEIMSASAHAWRDIVTGSEKELQNKRLLLPLILAQASIEDRMARAAVGQRARGDATRVGVDASTEDLAQVRGLQRIIAEGQQRQGQISASYGLLGGDALPASQQQAIAQQLLQERQGEEIQVNQLVTARNSLLARQLTIDTEITNERLKQQQAAAAALATASREDQVRAALLAREAKAGRTISAEQFQFLGQETRGAISRFQPDIGPKGFGLGGRAEELEREKSVLAKFDEGAQAMTEAVIQGGNRFGELVAAAGNAFANLVSEISVSRDANAARQGSAQTVNITVAPGAVPISMTKPIRELQGYLEQVVINTVKQEIAAIASGGGFKTAGVPASVRAAGVGVG